MVHNDVHVHARPRQALQDVLTAIRERDPGRDPNPGDRIDTIEIEES